MLALNVDMVCATQGEGDDRDRLEREIEAHKPMPMYVVGGR